MKEANQYSSINFEDRQILSKDAIRSLLDQAIRIKKNKTGEELKRSDIQNTKEYYSHWKRERKIYKKIGLSFLFSLAFAWLLYSPEFDLIAKIATLSIFLFWRAASEYVSTKCSYIHEMLGDISFLDKEEEKAKEEDKNWRKYYTRGLKVEVFGGTEKCSIKYVETLLAVTLLFGVAVCAALMPELKQQAVGIGAMIMFFANQMSFIKE